MDRLSFNEKVKRGVSFFMENLFQYPRALMQILDLEEGRIVSDAGREVLSDPQKMQKVHRQIAEHYKNRKTGDIVVSL